MSLGAKAEAKPVAVGQSVRIILGSIEYPGLVKAVTLGGRGQLLSFSAVIVGSGRAPVRRFGKDEDSTWRRVAR